MTERRWFVSTLGLMLLGELLVCGSSYAFDIFGVFRDTHGRKLQVYNNERTAKYLMNQRYVPENFDALLIGSSLSANWQTSEIAGAKVYNESLDGGNATEEKVLVDQALLTGHFRFAVCVLNVVMTRDHTLKEGGMGTPTRTEALSSISVIREESRKTWDALRHAPPAFFPDGSKVLIAAPQPVAIRQMELIAPDAEGVRDYKALLGTLRGKGIRIIFVVPPVDQVAYSAVGREMTEQYGAANGLVQAGEAVIDFNGEGYSDFRADDSNYSDALHLSPRGAWTLSRSLDREVQRVLHPAR